MQAVLDKPKSTAMSEAELIATARQVVSECNWTVGECASKWTYRYAKGRTDGAFGELIGISGDRVYQCRRTYDEFSNSRFNFPNLCWSHFHIALNWSDAAEWLSWANEAKATVNGMRLARDERPTGSPPRIDTRVKAGIPTVEQSAPYRNQDPAETATEQPASKLPPTESPDNFPILIADLESCLSRLKAEIQLNWDSARGVRVIAIAKSIIETALI